MKNTQLISEQILLEPVEVMRDPSVNPRVARLAALVAEGDHSDLGPAAVGQLQHEGAA